MIQLIVNSVLLGVGLAMDAFSVSIANGIIEPEMRKMRMLKIAGVYAVAQFLMPMIGWFLVAALEGIFKQFSVLIPWIALILLLFIGGKMIFVSVMERKNGKKDDEESGTQKLTLRALIIQGIATSIDALSVGFTISDYSVLQAFASSLIIGAVTLMICLIGLVFGRKIGERVSGIATIIGGVILILIGIEIFVKGIFGL